MFVSRQLKAILVTATLFVALPAAAQREEGMLAPPGGGSQPKAAAATGPGPVGANDAAFKQAKAQCEAARCAPRGGEACVQAAQILMSDDPPSDLREVNKGLLTKYALRMLEYAIPSNNQARGRAFDIYNSFEMFGGYSDAHRAGELMQMMLADKYIGGQLRQAKRTVGLITGAGLTDQDKTNACNFAKSTLAKGGLDADAARVAREVTEVHFCTALEPAKN